MGCCLSRSTTPTTTPPSSTSAKPASHCKPHNSARDQAAEEETVKEVLTETPIPVAERKRDERIEAGERKSEGVVVEVKQQEQRRVEAFEIRSEKSEITVATENRSAAAAVSVSVSESGGGEEVMSQSRDRDKAEVVVSRNQRSVERSAAMVSRRRPYSGELTAAGPREKRVRSPAKKVAPSPEKKTQTAAPRPVRGRSQSPATSNHRNFVNSGPVRGRRDPGDRSGRRSRSPSRTAFQNSSIRAGPGSEVNAGVNGGQRQLVEACGMSRAEKEEEEICAAAESLDNPLVSMECFIFL